MTTTTTPTRFARPRHGRVLGGVCAGIARRYGMKASTVRLLALLSCILPGPQFVLYLIVWIATPESN